MSTTDKQTQPQDASTAEVVNNNQSTTSTTSSTSSKLPPAPSSLPNTPITSAPKQNYHQNHQNHQNHQQPYPSHMSLPPQPHQQQIYNQHMQPYPHQPYPHKNHNMKGQYNNNNNNNYNYPNYNNHDNYQHKINNQNRLNNNNNINRSQYDNNNNNGGFKKGPRNFQPNPLYNQPNPMIPIPYGAIQPQYAFQSPVAPSVHKLKASPTKKHTKLSIKTKDGTPVDFTPSHTKSSSISNIDLTTTTSTTKVSNVASTSANNNTSSSTSDSTTVPETKSSVPVNNSSSSSSSKPTEEPKGKTLESKKAFQLQFLKQLQEKKKGISSTTKASTTSKVETNESSNEKSKSIESNEPKVETKIEETIPETSNDIKTEIQKEESTPVTETINEPTTESKIEEKTESLSEIKSDDNKKDEKPVESSEGQSTESKTSDEPKSESNEQNNNKLNKPSLPQTGISMTEFFEKIQNAKPISDPFDFKYSEGFHAPDESLKSRKVISYDPIFLLQFDKIHYNIDDEWKAKYLSKIYIPDKNESRDKSFKNRDNRSRSNGPMKGMPIRGEFEGRNNSRTGSKRKGRDSRDNRERSRRGGDREKSGKSRGNRNEKSEKDEKPQIKLAPEEVKPLEKTANRWVPKSQKQVVKEVKYAPDGVTILYDDEDLQKKIRSLLNKLSLEQFDSITDDLIQLANQSKFETDANALRMTVQLTFAKATDEPHWSSMYAKFCQKLVSAIDENIYSVDYPMKTDDDEVKYYCGKNLAYRLLVSRCQSEYEKGWSTELPVNEDGSPIEPELMSDEYYALAAQKRRGLGLVRFIGELYRLKLIKFRVIVGCIKILTTEKDEEGNPKPASDDYLPQEDTLETLNQFLLTVGQQLEAEVPNCIDYVFQRINAYINNPKIGSRIKYKFLDLIDLRKARWRDATAKLSGPKTISQIHEEFNKKATAGERERSSRNRSNKNNSKWGNDHISSTDISKVGMIRKSDESQVNILRKGKSVTSLANDFTTVSRTKSTRGTAQPISRTASTSSTINTSTNTEEESRQQSNRFNLLMDDEDSAPEENDAEEEEEEEVEEEEKNDEAEEEENLKDSTDANEEEGEAENKTADL